MPLCLELILVIVYGYAEAFYTKSLGHNGDIMNNTGDLKQLRESQSGSFEKMQVSLVELTLQVLVMRKTLMKSSKTKHMSKTTIPIYSRTS
ncbi:hypothetical protein P692DRAFT_20826609 [Suillus brevipes Sb2]|jgi:hypothetical protein|nr:hypothetical protein P692DRAFT_20841800 [Suillus brevipes Sb2]KAG2755606.1 hypothetical protein P692DRAFT_20826609 [Suillus brevipes Sb2]